MIKKQDSSKIQEVASHENQFRDSIHDTEEQVLYECFWHYSHQIQRIWSYLIPGCLILYCHEIQQYKGSNSIGNLIQIPCQILPFLTSFQVQMTEDQKMAVLIIGFKPKRQKTTTSFALFNSDDAMADQQDWVVADKVRTTTIMLCSPRNCGELSFIERSPFSPLPSQ